jgi:hypothetical protein
MGNSSLPTRSSTSFRGPTDPGAEPVVEYPMRGLKQLTLVLARLTPLLRPRGGNHE